jgi:hypothetical protein
MLSDLIEALNIFLRRGDLSRPTACKDGSLHVLVDPMRLDGDTLARLAQLGFDAHPDEYCFKSSRFGGRPRGA